MVVFVHELEKKTSLKEDRILHKYTKVGVYSEDTRVLWQDRT